jgi:hypothetical protein
LKLSFLETFPALLVGVIEDEEKGGDEGQED